MPICIMASLLLLLLLLPLELVDEDSHPLPVQGPVPH